MRIIPLITALLVAVFLYFFVFQRDILFDAVGASDAPSETETATQNTAEPGAETNTARTVSVVVMRSTAQGVDSAVQVQGQTQAARQVRLLAETSGAVISTPLRKGSFVKEGQEMCVLDPGTRAASLAEAQARLAEAQARVPETAARVAEAEARLEEALISDNAAAKLAQDGFASDTRVAAATAATKAARAAVASAQSGLQSSQAGIQAAEAGVAAAEKEIERLTIRAAFDGILETDTAELGSLLQPGALCATVLQLDPMKLVGFVPETEIDRVELGALAGAKLVSGRDVRGTVSFLSRSADPLTRTFAIEVTVPNPDLSLRDGQTAEILIQAEGNRAHLLPGSALTLNDAGTLGVRVADENSITRFMPVRLLRDTAQGVWVTGLPDQADVIIVGQEFVIDGVALNVTYQETDQ